MWGARATKIHIALQLHINFRTFCNCQTARAFSTRSLPAGHIVTHTFVALVVEDEAMLRFALAQDLQAAGYKTYEAENASEAIRVMEDNPDIRVVFTDVQMPGTMDGLALSRYVRDRWPPTIIVVTSGRCSPSASEMAAGAMFLAKPYPDEKLSRLLERIRDQLC